MSITTGEIDFHAAMSANLTRVFAEHDRSKRLAAIRDLYRPDAVLYELGTAATGPEEIADAVDALWSHLPPGFEFSVLADAIGHHDTGRLRWQVGPPGAPAAATGTDVAQFAHGQIARLYVFLDPQS